MSPLRPASGHGVKGVGPAPTAAQLAAAIAAAAGVRGLSPDLAFHPTTEARRVRTLAGAALRARLQSANTVLAEVLSLHAQELSPFMVAKAGVTTDEMLTVVEAVAAVPVEIVAASEAPVTEVPAPAAVVPVVAQLRAAPVRPVLGVEAARPAPAKPSTPRRMHDALPDRPLPAPRFPSQQRARVAAPRAAVLQLKPISADIARWSRWFDGAGWPVDQVAELFDVDAEALREAVAA